ncbi:MAG: hypothetical protein JW927_02960 [Deltaproteobacteria bacterium]|nr:hypothetical protein [Deltaproteobacteria bacterium]
MINNEKEYKTTVKRIAHFQKQAEHLRQTEKNSENNRLAASGFLTELDRMNLDVREYLWAHPSRLNDIQKYA